MFPAIHPVHSTAFKYYVNCPKPDATPDLEFASQSGVIAGETRTVEFHTAGSSGLQRNQSCRYDIFSPLPCLDSELTIGVLCRYFIGVRDKITNKVIVRCTAIHIITREIKAFKSLESLATISASEGRAQARNVLGEAFGSKKTKQAIQTAARNRVDVSAMEGVASHLQDTIDAGTGGLPSGGTYFSWVLDAIVLSADTQRPRELR